MSKDTKIIKGDNGDYIKARLREKSFPWEDDEDYIEVDWDAFVMSGLRELHRIHGQKDEGE